MRGALYLLVALLPVAGAVKEKATGFDFPRKHKLGALTGLGGIFCHARCANARCAVALVPWRPLRPKCGEPRLRPPLPYHCLPWQVW